MAKKALNEMSFLDHLEELRWLLVRSTSAVLIMAVVTYFFSDFIFDTIILFFVKIPQNKFRGERRTKTNKTPRNSPKLPTFFLNIVCNGICDMFRISFI